MQRKPRKKRRACKNCGVRFSGRYCPYCGAENGRKHPLRSNGVVVVFLRFLLSLLALAVLLFVAFVVLDYVAASGDGAHTTAIAIVESVKNALPEKIIDLYTEIQTNYLDVLWEQLSQIFSF